MSIESELLALKKGEFLVAEEVHSWAKAHPESALYLALQWDDEKAAYEHRLWQIRRLISIHITYAGGERKFISLSVDRGRTGGGYRDLDDVIRDRSLYAVALADALRELERMREKYEHLKQLKPIWSAVRKVRTRTATKAKGGGRPQATA